VLCLHEYPVQLQRSNQNGSNGCRRNHHIRLLDQDQWTLTADSYFNAIKVDTVEQFVNSIENNGYSIYYLASNFINIVAFNSATYDLPGSGKLLPYG